MDDDRDEVMAVREEGEGGREGEGREGWRKTNHPAVLASLGSQPYPTPDKEMLKGAERAFKYVILQSHSLSHNTCPFDVY